MFIFEVDCFAHFENSTFADTSPFPNNLSSVVSYAVEGEIVQSCLVKGVTDLQLNQTEYPSILYKMNKRSFFLQSPH